jgi:RNA polymerase sigma factor (sigma-70 family)
MLEIKDFEQYTDAEIVQKIVQGDYRLFEIIIRRNNPYMYKVGRSYNFDHEDTQDLMQDAFIDAYLNLGKFENRSSLKTWLITIMLHKCYQKQQKWVEKNIINADILENAKPLFSTENHSNPSNSMVQKELNHVIENALQAIPQDYRMVFSLREINGLNVAETAHALNISEANVKVRLNRAKTMLRAEVEKSYSASDIYEFNLIYCDGMVEKVMEKIAKLKNDQ